MEVEKNLEEEQVASLSSGVIQEALATNMVRPLPQACAWSLLACSMIAHLEKVSGAEFMFMNLLMMRLTHDD